MAQVNGQSDAEVEADAVGQVQQAEANVPPQRGLSPDPTPTENCVDGNARQAKPADQRRVYMWTFSHTDKPGRARPSDYTREQFAVIVVEAYEANGKLVEQWSVFMERHPSSMSSREKELHFHMIAETEKPMRWLEVARYLRERHQVFASATTSSSRQSYWAAFAYLYSPSVKKQREDLDQDFLLSPGHEEPPAKLVDRRVGDRRIKPLEVYNTIAKHDLDSLMKFHAFASRQMAAGDPVWVQHCMRQGDKKLKDSIATAISLQSADSNLRRSAMTHMEILQAALSEPCICFGKAIPGWEQVLVLNGVSVQEYKDSVVAMFEGGGGKGLNHMYIGDPSTGKTALTRPVLALFGSDAFVKPQKDTTFALEGLIGAKAVVWNDFRWPLPPLAWGDLLNLFDNEPFRIAVPKHDGQKDHHWNADGKDGVICFLTSNSPVVYVSGGTVNTVETAAWNERFGRNVYEFKHALPNKDARFKQWGKCTSCYAHWLLDGRASRAPQGPTSSSPALSALQSDAGIVAEPTPPLEPLALQPAPQTAPLPSPLQSRPKRRRSGRAPGSAQASAPPTVAGPSPFAVPAFPTELSTAARANEAPSAPILPVAPLPNVDSNEPLRELHDYLQRMKGKPEYVETQAIPGGPWLCQVSALGLSATATSRTKKEAKREAGRALLRCLASRAGHRPAESSLVPEAAAS